MFDKRLLLLGAGILGFLFYKKSKTKSNPMSGKNIEMPLDEVITEHKRLVKVLESGKAKDLKKELKYQSAELEDYKLQL